MGKKCTLVFLYLILMIPRYDNNPIPQVKSWLQSEKDDGFIDDDLTSSFAEDETFGSEQENELIREKKAISSVSKGVSRIADKRKFKSKGRPEETELENADTEYRDESYLSGKNKAEPAFEEFDSNADNAQYDRYQPVHGRYQKNRVYNSPCSNNYRGSSRYMNSDRDRFRDRDRDRSQARYQLSNFKEHTFMHNDDVVRGCGRSCRPPKNKYAPDITLGVMEVLKLEGGKKDQHSENCEEANFRDNDKLKEDKISENVGKETDENMAEEEYYDTESKDSAVDDYNQMGKHDMIYKRDDSKSEAKADAKLKSDKSELTKDNVKNSDAVKDDDSDLHNTNLVWKMNSNIQAKELSDVMKDSQRALEEVQQFQQKLKSNNNPDVKLEDSAPVSSDKENDKFKDNRDKREDEDEQKNMKTGTDEGGKEYEDEEGKGHHDEEEYYEEIDEGEGNLKREAAKEEAKASNSKSSDASAADEDDEDEDDELSLKNAPIENVQDQKKIKIEGENKEKKDVRKGAKIWDQWGKWSPCSVTCGVGRSVRWRHCIGGGCAKGEKEAQIKTCTNPAC